MSSVGIQKSQPVIKQCRTCQHINKKANVAMTAQGFALCNLGPKWEFHPPTGLCNQWKEKS